MFNERDHMHVESGGTGDGVELARKICIVLAGELRGLLPMSVLLQPQLPLVWSNWHADNNRRLPYRPGPSDQRPVECLQNCNSGLDRRGDVDGILWLYLVIPN